MGRYFVLTLMAVMLGGCLASGETEGTVSPDSTEEPQDGFIRTFDGRLQRPLAPVGTPGDAVIDVESRAIWNATDGVDRAGVQLGGKYARSAN